MKNSTKTFLYIALAYFIFLLLFTSCSMQKHADPCRQCPQYSHNNNNNYILWEYIKLSPYPHEYASKQ